MYGNSLMDDSDVALAAIAGDWFGLSGGTQASVAGQISSADRAAAATADLLYGEGGSDWYLPYFGDKIATANKKAPRQYHRDLSAE